MDRRDTGRGRGPRERKVEREEDAMGEKPITMAMGAGLLEFRAAQGEGSKV